MPCFYVGRLRRQSRALRWLGAQLPRRFPVRVRWTKRRDLWSGDWRTVLEVGVRRLEQYAALVRWGARARWRSMTALGCPSSNSAAGDEDSGGLRRR